MKANIFCSASCFYLTFILEISCRLRVQDHWTSSSSSLNWQYLLGYSTTQSRAVWGRREIRGQMGKNKTVEHIIWPTGSRVINFSRRLTGFRGCYSPSWEWKGFLNGSVYDVWMRRNRTILIFVSNWKLICMVLVGEWVQFQRIYWTIIGLCRGVIWYEAYPEKQFSSMRYNWTSYMILIS